MAETTPEDLLLIGSDSQMNGVILELQPVRYLPPLLGLLWLSLEVLLWIVLLFTDIPEKRRHVPCFVR